jgi:hypothetical protein
MDQLEPLRAGERAEAKRMAAEWTAIGDRCGDEFTDNQPEEPSGSHNKDLDAAGAQVYLRRQLGDLVDRVTVKHTRALRGHLILDRDDERRPDTHPFALVAGSLDDGYRFVAWGPGARVQRRDGRFESKHGGALRYAAPRPDLDQSIEALLAYLRGQAPSGG